MPPKPHVSPTTHWDIYSWQPIEGLILQTWVGPQLSSNHPTLKIPPDQIISLDTGFDSLPEAQRIETRFRAEEHIYERHRYLGLIYLDAKTRLVYAADVDPETEAADDRGGHAMPEGITMPLTLRHVLIPGEELPRTMKENWPSHLLDVLSSRTIAALKTHLSARTSVLSQRLEREKRAIFAHTKPVTMADYEQSLGEIMEFATQDASEMLTTVSHALWELRAEL